jgi:hypothetical protein
LEIFDWVAGSIGRVSSWRLEGDTGTGPTVYCTSGTSANGCVPAISATHQPSASLAHGCLITIVDADAQRSGLIFYGIDNTGFTPTTWGTGFLCSKVALQRTGLQSTGGNTYLCSGTLTLDWNAYQTSHPTALGNPFIAGRKAYVQGWNRDPASQKVSVMSNALEMTYQP